MRLTLALAAAFAVALACPARAEVEVVRPIPRAAGGHGFTIEVPTPGAVGSFEVLRGGRLPDPNADAGTAPPDLGPSPAPSPGPALNVVPPPRTIQVAPVRPVEVAPVGLHGRGNTAPANATAGAAPTGLGTRTVQVRRGPFARPPLAALPGPDDDVPFARDPPTGVPGLPGALLGGLLGGAAAPAASGPAPGVPPLPPGARVIRIR